MRHWVQYHNPDKHGEYTPEEGHFGIFTDKCVHGLVGDRVWLVSRNGKPRKYIFVLCETFVVEKFGKQKSGPLQYTAEAWQGGKSFSPPVRIDAEPWFGRLLRMIRFGLSHVKDEEIIQGLLRVASKP
jgi:hypothetical protein